MRPPERVRSPRDVHGAPPRLDSGDADAAARRVLGDYVRQQQAVTRQVRPRASGSRWLAVGGLALLGAALGAGVGTLAGDPILLGGALAVVGALLGGFTTRR